MTSTCACVAAPPAPRGIGGWLILPMLGTVLSPAFYMREVFYHFGVLANPASPLSASWTAFVWAEIVIAGLLVAAWVYAVFMLFQHKRIFPNLFIGLIAVAFVLSLVDTAVAAQWFKLAPDEASILNTIRPLIGIVIFGPYMAKSIRVKNTFVH